MPPASPSEPVFEVIDDLAPAEIFAAARKACANKGWYFGHGSHDNDAVPFWKMELNGDAAFDAIWLQIKARCEALAGSPLRVIRQYANGHTFGLGGKPHQDDNRPGSYTLLYYPMEEWRDGWDGETVFYDASGEIASAIRPRPNRAVFFDSRILHAGRAPSRACPALRISVAYKLEAVVAPEPPASIVPIKEDAPPNDIKVEETERDGSRRVYSVQVPAEVVDKRKLQHLVNLGKSVRLPGFRPGKIPAPVLEQRYGAKSRADVVNRLAAESADQLMARGGLTSKIEIVSGDEAGDLAFRLTVTHLPDLPAVDFSELELERLTAEEPAEGCEEVLQDHLRQQVLDYLNSVYEFPLAPALVEREFEAIWSSAAAQLEAEATTREAREEITAELREIAERRVRLGAVVAEMARRYEVRATEDDIRSYKAGAETAAQTRSRVTEAKVIDLFISRARVTERVATPGEIRDLAGN